MKTFYTMDNIGKAKYTVNMHDGISKHSDGGPFFGIKIFRNKKLRDKCISELLKEGYKERT